MSAKNQNNVTDDMEWNELTIVTKKDGKINVYKAWKSELLAWMSPVRWQDPDKWNDRSSLKKSADGAL